MTDDNQHERHLASHIFNLVAMVAGAVGLGWMLHEVGWSHLVDAVESVGAWFWLILALDLCVLGFDAAALQAFMRPEARMVSYWRVLGAQASGRAINVLTPTGALGEPTKLSMLISHAPRDRVLSSLVLQNLAGLYLSVTIIVIGTPLLFLLIDIPHTVKIAVAVGFAILLPAMVALAIVVRRGAVSTLVALIRATRLISDERARTWRTRMTEVDRHIREVQSNVSHGTWKGLLWIGASKLVNWTSTFITMYFAGIPISPTLVVAMLSVGVLIQWFANIVPMGLGVADGGNYALFDLLGETAANGIVVTMLHRARSIAVAILGLGAMAAIHVVNRVILSRMHRRLAELKAQQQT